MRNIFLISLMFCYGTLSAQVDSISLVLNIRHYDSVSNVELEGIHHNNEEFASRFTRVISIPIFVLNDKAKEYHCGENMEELISFRHDPNYQYVLLVNEQKVVYEFGIFDSYKQRRDSKHDDSSAPLYGQPILLGDDGTYKLIPRFLQKNIGGLVFMIENLDGFWAIRNGKLIKLQKGLFNHVKEKDANTIFCRYGEEFIRDVATNYTFKVGYAYSLCDCDKVPKSIYVKVVAR